MSEQVTNPRVPPTTIDPSGVDPLGRGASELGRSGPGGFKAVTPEDVVERALAELRPIAAETINQLRQGSDLDRGTILPDGRTIHHPNLPRDFVTLEGGAALTPRQFLVTYCEAHNKVVAAAAELVRDFGSSTALVAERARTTSGAPVGLIGELPSGFSSWERPTQLSYLDTEIRRGIVSIARENNPLRVRVLALDLAILSVAHQERMATVQNFAGAHQLEIAAHARIVENAVRSANDVRHPLARTPADQALLATLESKLEATGKIPRLIVFNDIDNNLAPHDTYNRHKPSDGADAVIDDLLAQVEAGIPIPQRIVLIHPLQTKGKDAEVLEDIYRDVGRRIESELFRDVIPLARRAAEEGVDFHLLTANLEVCGEGVRHALGHPKMQVFGAAVDSVRGFEKALALADVQLRNPDAVMLLSDDGDSSIRKAIKAGAMIPGMPPIEHTMLFAARVSVQADGRTFKLEPELSHRGIPFFPNSYDAADEGGAHGYQGTTRAIELYLEWRAQKRVAGFEDAHAPNI